MGFGRVFEKHRGFTAVRCPILTDQGLAHHFLVQAKRLAMQGIASLELAVNFFSEVMETFQNVIVIADHDNKIGGGCRTLIMGWVRHEGAASIARRRGVVKKKVAVAGPRNVGQNRALCPALRPFNRCAPAGGLPAG